MSSFATAEKAAASSKAIVSGIREFMGQLLLRFRNQRQLDETGAVRRVVDSLSCFAIVFGFGPEDVLHKRLWIAIVEREPARLNLHDDPVAREKDVISRRQCESIEQGSVC